MVVMYKPMPDVGPSDNSTRPSMSFQSRVYGQPHYPYYIYQLEENVNIEPYGQLTKVYTFRAISDDVAVKSCLIHPFRLTPFKLRDAEGKLIYEHLPSDPRNIEVSITDKDVLSNLYAYTSALNSTSSVPIKLRESYDSLLDESKHNYRKFDSLIEEIFDNPNRPELPSLVTRRKIIAAEIANTYHLGISS